MAFHLPSLSELRNTEFEIFKFQTRVMVLQGLVLACFALLATRLFYVQVIPVSYTHLTLPTILLV